MHRVATVPPHKDLISEGDDPRYVNMILEGWACRYRQFEDGRRQIISLFLPGDICDPVVFLLNEMSHALGALTHVTIARVSHGEMLAMMESSANLSKAFWLDALITAEIQREWTTSLGRRTAIERLAHLLCELSIRLNFVGLHDGTDCELPVTQTDLADALGLSAVHVNRTLQDLRATGLIELRGKRLTIRNENELQALATFDAKYLHVMRESNA